MKKLLIAILLMLTAPFAFAYDKTYVQIMVKTSECKILKDISGDIPLARLREVPVTTTVELMSARAKKENWSPDLVKLKDILINMWYTQSLVELLFDKYEGDKTDAMIDMIQNTFENFCIMNKGIMYIDNRVVGRK